MDYVVKGCPDEDILRHIRNAYGGKPVMESRSRKPSCGNIPGCKGRKKAFSFFINNVSQLTSAERELLRLLLDGKKVKDIAQIRCVEIITVKTQIKGLLRKFGCSRTKEIVSMIQELNISHLF